MANFQDVPSKPPPPTHTHTESRYLQIYYVLGTIPYFVCTFKNIYYINNYIHQNNACVQHCFQNYFSFIFVIVALCWILLFSIINILYFIFLYGIYLCQKYVFILEIKNNEVPVFLFSYFNKVVLSNYSSFFVFRNDIEYMMVCC